VRDIATVAAKALRCGEHEGKTYELNGPEALTCANVAEKISKHAGIAARYVDIPVEALRKAMLDQRMPEWQVTALLELAGILHEREGRNADGVLEGLLGRPSITMDQFLENIERVPSDPTIKPYVRLVILYKYFQEGEEENFPVKLARLLSVTLP